MSKSQKWKSFFFISFALFLPVAQMANNVQKVLFSLHLPCFFLLYPFPITIRQSFAVSLFFFVLFFLFLICIYWYSWWLWTVVKKDKVQADHWTFSAPAFYLLSAMAFVGSVTFPVSVWLHSHRTCLALSFFSFLDHCNILQSSGSPPYSKTTSATSQHTSITHSDTHPWFLRPSLTRSQDKVLLLFYQ